MPNDFTVAISPPALMWRVDPPAVDGRRSVQAQISTLSTEYVTVLVAARESGADVNLASGATVRFAFLPEGTAPSSGDWTAGSWDTDSSGSPTRYYARVLFGTGATDLAVGTYVVWVEVTRSPETVVRAAGYLRVT